MGEVLAPEVREETGLSRQESLQRLFAEIDSRLDPLPRKPWAENDSIVEKYRRKGLIEKIVP